MLEGRRKGEIKENIIDKRMGKMAWLPKRDESLSVYFGYLGGDFPSVLYLLLPYQVIEGEGL